jgi:hypothetical protein
MNKNKRKEGKEIRKRIFFTKDIKNKIAKNTLFKNWCQNAKTKNGLGKNSKIFLTTTNNFYQRINFFRFMTY